MNPIPPDMNIQEQWRNHDVCTDEMVAYLKKTVGCESYHGLTDINQQAYYNITGKLIPEGKVCWMKIDRREGALNIYKDNIVFTDPNGSNPLYLQ